MVSLLILDAPSLPGRLQHAIVSNFRNTIKLLLSRFEPMRLASFALVLGLASLVNEPGYSDANR
jgi:hypothetical protein